MFKIMLSAILVIGALPFLTNIALSEYSATCSFAGSVKVDGVDVADGTAIIATIKGIEYRTTTPTGYGASTYAILIQPPQGIYYEDGSTVTFRIESYEADQTGSWQSGKNIRLDLTASTVSAPLASESSSNIWSTIGIAIAFFIELMMVGTIGYIVIRQWNQ